MKKLAIALIAIVALTACTPCTVVDGGTQELYIDTAKARMQLPGHFHMNVQRKLNSEPRIYAIFGEKYHSNGDLKPMIRLTFEHKEYEEYMAENWDAPYFPLQNSCEPEGAILGEAFGCEQYSDTITSYYQTNKMGNLSAAKKYYFERSDNDWHQVEVWVDLYTDDFEESLAAVDYDTMKAEFAKLQLTAEQKHRIQMAEDIIESLEI